jgi:hypothetical protein
MDLMNRSALVTLFIPGLVLSLALPAVAGQPLQCPKAASSSNGNFLVLTDVQVEHGQGHAVKVQRVSLQVFPKEQFLNTRLTAPATYWTDWPRWDVVLDSAAMHNEPKCPMALISDDGEFLILLRIAAVFSGEDAVMQIYRWDHRYEPASGNAGDHGVLIKAIDLKQIWSPEKLPAKFVGWTDETPEWFAGGTFEFSSDYRQLIHETRWGNIVHINLVDGSVSWK